MKTDNQHIEKGGVVLTDEQQQALAELASSNMYAKQSKFKTFRELDKSQRWDFFVQHFLLATIAIIAAVGLVLTIAISALTRGPDPQLYIAGVNMSEVSEPMLDLEHVFAKEEGLDPELIDYADGIFITEDGTLAGSVDGSAKLMTMVSSGTINAIITDSATFERLAGRGLVSPLEDVLEKKTLTSLGSIDDAVLSAPTGQEQVTKPAGLKLNTSTRWKQSSKLPQDAILAFANVQKTGVTYPRAFVSWLWSSELQ